MTSEERPRSWTLGVDGRDATAHLPPGGGSTTENHHSMASPMNPPPSTSDSESHRIYWQQWLASNETSVGTRREWVTSSAAVRISRQARAADVTALLRESLCLPSNNSNNREEDALVLVGTLYSLSRDYVRFTHEMHREGSSSRRGTVVGGSSSSSSSHRQLHGHAPNIATSTASSSSTDAYNVLLTLRPTDSPLDVRDDMAAHLRHLQAQAVVGRSIIAPKLQWYYCPAVASSLPSPDDVPGSKGSQSLMIPTCINLEGYCTSREEEEGDWGYDDDENDESEDDKDDTTERLVDLPAAETVAVDEDETDSSNICGGTVHDIDMLSSRFPWLRTQKPQDSIHDSNGSDSPARRTENGNAVRCHIQNKRQVHREHRRSHMLVAQEAAAMAQGPVLSGYLLKRSHHDRHVWRRVHCVLTDDYLWFVSRRYARYDMTYAKHGRVRLTRALLLQPSADYAPLYRTPYAFEMVAADGTSHVFRAANRAVQQQWIQAISDRIIQSFENSLVETAQLLVNDESVAHARRVDQAVEQFWNRLRQSQAKEQQEESSLVTLCTTSVVARPWDKPASRILRWTLKVTDYRHFCRHVRSCLPARSPVVVISSTTSPLGGHQQKRLIPSPAALTRERSSEGSRTTLDPWLHALLGAAWQQAALLWQEAVALMEWANGEEIALDSKNQSAHHVTRLTPHRNLETLLRHVEFVVTGRHRSLSAGSLPTSDTTGTSSHVVSGTSYQDREEPPPMDLFDSIEQELQGLVARS